MAAPFARPRTRQRACTARPGGPRFIALGAPSAEAARRPGGVRGRAARPLSRRAAGGGLAGRGGAAALRRCRARRRGAARKSHRLAGGEEIAIEPPPPLPRSLLSRCPSSRSRTRTSTSSSWTSRPGSWCTRRPDIAGRHARPGTRGSGCRGRGGGPSGDRPPPRPRHVRPARRGAFAGGVRGAAGARPPPRADSRVPGARRREAAVAEGHDRRAGRPRPPRPAPSLARHGHAPRGGDALRARGARCRGTRSCASGSRPAVRTRSASISPRSTSWSPATRPTGSHGISASSGSSSTLRGSPSSIPSRAPRVDVSSPLPPDLAAALERAR